MKTLWLIVHFLSSNIQCEVYKGLPIFSRTVAGNILLEEECSRIKEHVKSLREWTNNLEGRKCDEPPQRVNDAGRCVLEITDCVPSFVKKYHKLTTYHDGPNCWNTSLLLHGLTPFMRESSEIEFEFLIRSPFCKEIKDHKKIKVGDIGTVEAKLTNGYVNHFHSFIYINEEVIFNKVGLSLHSGFELSSFDDMRENYPLRLTGECEKACSLDIPFDLLVDGEKVFNLKKKFNIKNLPKPSYFCRFLYNHPLDFNNTLVGIIKADITPYEDGLLELSNFFTEGCTKFFEKEKLVSAVGSVCGKNCQLPRQKYYRCISPEKFYSKGSKENFNLFFNLNKIVYPLEKAFEEHLILNKVKEDDLRSLYKKTVEELAFFLKAQKINFKNLDEMKKLIIRQIIFKTIEMTSYLKEVDFLKIQLNEFYLESIKGVKWPPRDAL